MNKKYLPLLAAIMAMISIYLITKKGSTPTRQAGMGDIIIIGTNAEFPPFSSINEKNEIVGFDIDIAKEVITRLQKNMEIKDRSFDMLIPEAQNGSVHIIAAGMTATPERAQQVIFTKPYLKGEPLVVITLKKNQIKSLDELKGKEIIVNEGYTADAYMSKQSEVNIKRLPAPAESFMDLQTGKSFAYVSALNAAKPFIDKFGADQFNIFTIEGTDENTAMGISKKYPELLEKIQPVLDQMESDGTIEKLKKKWNIG